MLYQNYINQSIENHNRLIYIKNGRFIAIIIIALFSIIMFSDNSYLSLYLNVQNKLIENPLMQLLYGTITCAPIILLMIWFSISLIPQYFKKSAYKKFWTLLSLGIVSSIVISYILHCLLLLLIPSINQMFFNQMGWLPIKTIIYNTLFSFLQFMSWLFLVESFENIRLIKDTQKVNNEYQSIVENKEMSNFNSHFLFQSLDKMIELTEDNSTEAPQYILEFSHALRYKLYNKSEQVLIEEEINQMKTMFSLNNFNEHNYQITNIGVPEKLQLAKYSVVKFQDIIIKNLSAPNDVFIDVAYQLDNNKLLMVIDINSLNLNEDNKFIELSNAIQNASFNETSEITFTEQTINIQLCIPTTLLSA